MILVSVEYITICFKNRNEVYILTAWRFVQSGHSPVSISVLNFHTMGTKDSKKAGKKQVVLLVLNLKSHLISYGVFCKWLSWGCYRSLLTLL